MVPPQPVDETMQQTGGWDARIMAFLESKPLPDLAVPGFAFPDDPLVRKILADLANYDAPLTAEEYWDLTQPSSESRDRLLSLLDTMVHLGILVRDRQGDGLLTVEPCLHRCLFGNGDGNNGKGKAGNAKKTAKKKQ
jgi:hypothetical protein